MFMMMYIEETQIKIILLDAEILPAAPRHWYLRPIYKHFCVIGAIINVFDFSETKQDYNREPLYTCVSFKWNLNIRTINAGERIFWRWRLPMAIYLRFSTVSA